MFRWGKSGFLLTNSYRLANNLVWEENTNRLGFLRSNNIPGRYFTHLGARVNHLAQHNTTYTIYCIQLAEIKRRQWAIGSRAEATRVCFLASTRNYIVDVASIICHHQLTETDRHCILLYTKIINILINLNIYLCVL